MDGRPADDLSPRVGAVEYVSRVPRPPLDGLIDDLYYLEGAPPYARLTLPPPAALLIVNLGAPFRIRAGTDIETAEYADGRTETVDVTGPLVVEIDGRDTIEEALIPGDEVLIGQTVLEKRDLFVDSRRRRLVPNPAHPDQPITKVKLAAIELV